MMSSNFNPSLTDRQAAAAAAKKAMLEKFKPKPTVSDPNFVDRETRKAAEREALRAQRATEKEAARRAAAERAEAARKAQLAADLAAAEAKRLERKERKALTKAEQRERKEERMAYYANLRRTG
jgi:Family of unknown function (DUF6481)